METGYLTFRNRKISYDCGWLNDEIFCFSLGDGDFQDESGDYYIEFEYYALENDWTISIVWGRDKTVVGKLNDPDKYVKVVGKLNEPDRYITVDEMEMIIDFLCGYRTL